MYKITFPAYAHSVMHTRVIIAAVPAVKPQPYNFIKVRSYFPRILYTGSDIEGFLDVEKIVQCKP